MWGMSQQHQRMGAIELTGAYTALVVTLLQTLVVPVTPLFPEIFSTSTSTASWIVTSTLLVSAVATPVASRSADLFGKRRVMIIALSLVLLGCLIAPFGGITGIIIGRALQGVGTAIVPVAMALMRDHVAPVRLNGALALLSAMLGLGGGVGIPLGGAIVAAGGWQAIFWVAALLVGIALVATVVAVPREGQPETSERFDWTGALILSVALTSFLTALSKAGAWGWTSPLSLSLFFGGLAVFAGWVVHQRGASEPLVDMSTAGYRPVLMVNIAALLLGFAMFINLLVTTIQLQNPPEEAGFALSPTIAGLAMIPSAAVSLVMAPIATKIARAFSPRILLVAGSLVVVAGYLLRWVFSPNPTMVIVWATVVTIGVSLGYAAFPMEIVAHVEQQHTASANGFNALLRSIGMSAGSSFVALASVLFQSAAGGASWASLIAIFLAGAVMGLGAALCAWNARAPKVTSHITAQEVSHA